MGAPHVLHPPQLGHYTAAIDYYDRAIKCLPGNARALGNRSAAYMAIRDFDRALTDADLAMYAPPTPGVTAISVPSFQNPLSCLVVSCPRPEL